ncbi:hypothetical protein BDZ91DRAFT_760031 [Kalaharituber pfeilii]|nr:hypothetical protein BDZ91DRAFT_760031 [Kalaharituber pfeilii]
MAVYWSGRGGKEGGRSGGDKRAAGEMEGWERWRLGGGGLLGLCREAGCVSCFVVRWVQEQAAAGHGLHGGGQQCAEGALRGSGLGAGHWAWAIGGRRARQRAESSCGAVDAALLLADSVSMRARGRRARCSGGCAGLAAACLDKEQRGGSDIVV